MSCRAKLRDLHTVISSEVERSGYKKKNMKKLIYITLALFSIWSCAQFDDSKIWDEFKNYYDRLEKVEAACDLMNSNISALQAIVTALQGNDFVTGVAEIVETGEVVGYTITFSKSGVVKIYHGEDGADGADGAPGADGRPGADGAAGSDGVDGENGHSPVVGVRKDFDGVYYWTIDGEWMLDADGQKVPATGRDGADAEEGAGGKDGVTPLLKIEDGYWFVSYDGGVNWTKLYKAVGENGADGTDGAPGAPGQDGKDGQSFFQGVDTSSSEDYIILTLADGTQIKLPTWKAFEELQTMVNKLNTNVSALQAIVEALENKEYITEITPTVESGVEVGYTISFSSGKSITIYHGKDGADGSDGAPGQNGEDGKDGKDGYTPVLGVKASDEDWSLDNDWDADSEGQTRYYWTLDGEWLLDSNGNRIPANGVNGTDGANGSDGKNGISPKLKIEDGYWYISLDGGQTWQPEPLGPATAGAGESIFSDISYDSAYIYITLSDGERISLSRSEGNVSIMCGIEPVEVTDRSVTFAGHLDVPEELLSYSQVTIYYSDNEDFNIFTAQKVSTSSFDYNKNFSLTLSELVEMTRYTYVMYIRVKYNEFFGQEGTFTTEEIKGLYNYSIPYDQWDWKGGLEGQRIEPDSFEICVELGTAIVLGRRLKLEDTPFKVGDTVYFGIENFEKQGGNLSLCFFKADGTEITPRLNATQLTDPITYLIKEVPEETTTIQIRIHGSQITYARGGKSYLATEPFDEHTKWQ